MESVGASVPAVNLSGKDIMKSNSNKYIQKKFISYYYESLHKCITNVFFYNLFLINLLIFT